MVSTLSIGIISKLFSLFHVRQSPLNIAQFPPPLFSFTFLISKDLLLIFCGYLNILFDIPSGLGVRAIDACEFQGTINCLSV